MLAWRMLLCFFRSFFSLFWKKQICDSDIVTINDIFIYTHSLCKRILTRSQEFIAILDLFCVFYIFAPSHQRNMISPEDGSAQNRASHEVFGEIKMVREDLQHLHFWCEYQCMFVSFKLVQYLPPPHSTVTLAARKRGWTTELSWSRTKRPNEGKNMCAMGKPLIHFRDLSHLRNAEWLPFRLLLLRVTPNNIANTLPISLLASHHHHHTFIHTASVCMPWRIEKITYTFTFPDRF